MQDIFYSYFSSPIGNIELAGNSNALISCSFVEIKNVTRQKQIITKLPLFINTIKQLTAYFNFDLQHFNLPLQFIGTDFQKKVWAQLTIINFGKTISYLQMAKNLGDPKCIRAAAWANGKNPFAVIIPYHRIIGINGALTGYASDLWRKEWLLKHEQKNKQIELYA